MTDASESYNFKFLPLSLQLETLGGIATPLILRGTPLPATRSETFSTASDNQQSVEVNVLVGESPLASKNQTMGSFYLKGIPPAPRGQPQIKVVFSIDTTGQLKANATANDQTVTVKLGDPKKFFSPKTVKEALEKAEAEKSEDQEKVSQIETTLSAEAAVKEAEKRLEKVGATSESGRRINELTAAVGLALDSEILEDIRLATQKLRNELVLNSGFNFDLFGDLFPGTPKSSPKPVSTFRRRNVEGQTAKQPTRKGKADSDPAPVRKGNNLGKIFGGGDFALDASLCFVLMPFAEKFQPFYEDHIQKVVSEAGLSSQRADEISSTRMITWDIWEKTNRARFLIADLTDRNPNVFYEVGLAHAISKDVILLTQSMGDIPFDLRSLRFIVYEYSPRGMVEFEKKLAAAISEILKTS